MGPVRHNNQGYSLVEMIIVMLIFVIVIGITGEAFNRIVSKALLQTKVAETNISGIVGLELLRMDVESAGYGLPWSFMDSISYSEATDSPGAASNDNNRTYASDSSQDGVPRAVSSINNVSSADKTVVFNQSDVLTIRSQSVAANAASHQWTYIESKVIPNTNPNPSPHYWNSNTENLAQTSRVVLVHPVSNLKAKNELVVNAAGQWSNTFQNYSLIGKPPAYSDAEKNSDAYIIYGVDDATDLRMPFNRADFFVRQPASTEAGSIRLPDRCNPSSGILFKGIVAQSNGSYVQKLPLLECVLDMQVVFGLVTPGVTVVTDTNDISSLTAKQIREQLKEIKIYLLTHDGGMDRNYTYPNATIGVGPGDGITSGTGRTYDFAANGVINWKNYRWRVYQIVARPKNLTGNNP